MEPHGSWMLLAGPMVPHGASSCLMVCVRRRDRSKAPPAATHWVVTSWQVRFNSGSIQVRVRSGRVESGQVKSSQVGSGQVRSGQVVALAWCVREALPRHHLELPRPVIPCPQPCLCRACTTPVGHTVSPLSLHCLSTFSPLSLHCLSTLSTVSPLSPLSVHSVHSVHSLSTLSLHSLSTLSLHSLSTWRRRD